MIQEFFETVANAALERVLPNVRDWLSARFGDGVELEAVEVDGPRVHLLSARIPLGPTVALSVERATLHVHAREVAQGQPPARLESLVGALVIPSDDGGPPRLHAPLAFEAQRAPTGSEWVYGVLTLRDARLRPSTGHGEAAPVNAEATLSLSSEAWTLIDGRVVAEDAQAALSAAGGVGSYSVETARVTVAGARSGHLIDAVAAVLGRELDLPLPLASLASFDGSLVLEAGGRVSAAARLETLTSALSFSARGSRDGGLERATLDGHVGLPDLLPSDAEPHIDAFESAPVHVAGELAGRWGELTGRLDFVADHLVTPHRLNALTMAGTLGLAPPGVVRGDAELAGHGVSARARLQVAGKERRLDVEFEPLDAATVVSVTDALGGASRLRLEGQSRRGAPFALPMDAHVGGRLRITDETLTGTLEAKTPRSRVRLSPIAYEFASRRMRTASLHGDLHAKDAVTLGLFAGPVRPVDGSVTGALELRGVFPKIEVEGRLHGAHTTWVFTERPDARPALLEDGRVVIFTDAERLVLRGLRGRLLGGQLGLDLELPYGGPSPALRVQLERADAGGWLSSVLGLPAPPGLVASLSVQTNAEKTACGAIRLATARSRAHIAVTRAASGELEGTRCDAVITLADVQSMCPEGGPAVAGEGIVKVAAAIHGSVSEPAAEAEVELIQGRGGHGVHVLGAGVPDFVLELVGARTQLHVAKGRLDVHELALEGYGGRVRASGNYVWDRHEPESADLHIDVETLALATLPIPGGGRVGHLLGGTLGGEASVAYRPGAAAPPDRLEVSGALRVDVPSYPALRGVDAAARLLGLDPPPTVGAGPLTCQLEGDALGLWLRWLRAGVVGARVAGDVRVGWSGALLGDVQVEIEERYLRTSTPLVVPAAVLGGLRVPVRLGGTLREPDYEPNYKAALGRVLNAGASGARSFAG